MAEREPIPKVERIPVFSNLGAIVDTYERMRDTSPGEERDESYEVFKSWLDEGVDDLVEKWKASPFSKQDISYETFATFYQSVDGKSLDVELQQINVSIGRINVAHLTIDLAPDSSSLSKMSVETSEPFKKRELGFRITEGFASFNLKTEQRSGFSINLKEKAVDHAS